ncbi:DUF6113 family protein [Sanguibacter antarcticus]|uniref:Integral membrane protein n=1 Tax=Sanguibacter antarcticus TaxID=372484 RepID=A0A2A9E3Y9_9MICO|nr:DUF6113 family protein [Sanguibacter antarcticus]PFG33757.1 hypothetical protein ATL42_1644 [Sanguibacter antarcticus]
MSARPRFSAVTVLAYIGALATGALVGLLGSVAHRQWMPWILVVALVAVGVAGILVRAWLGGAGIAAYGVGWLVVVQVLALVGPGGDILLPAQTSTYVWMIGGIAMIGLAAVAPRKWFLD